jgi:hypothetical protein
MFWYIHWLHMFELRRRFEEEEKSVDDEEKIM